MCIEEGLETGHRGRGREDQRREDFCTQRGQRSLRTQRRGGLGRGGIGGEGGREGLERGGLEPSSVGKADTFSQQTGRRREKKEEEKGEGRGEKKDPFRRRSVDISPGSPGEAGGGRQWGRRGLGQS